MNAAEFGLIFNLIFKRYGEPGDRISNQKCFFVKHMHQNYLLSMCMTTQVICLLVGNNETSN